MKSEKNLHLQETIKSIQEALGQWDDISPAVESDADEFRKKTRELLIKLSEQIKALDL